MPWESFLMYHIILIYHTIRAFTPYHNITPHTINLIPIQRRNPTNDHRAERKACCLLLVWRYSHTKAPTIGHAISPNGGKKNKPATNPIVDPNVPYVVPPNFFVPRCGIV